MTPHHPPLAFDSAPVPPPRAAGSRLPAHLWSWAPALLLTALIGTQVTVLSSVLQDPGFATEADYYRKAVDWDQQQVRARHSAALGWTQQVRVQGLGERELSVALRDARGQNVTGAVLEAVAFHNARAAAPRALAFHEVEPGVYRAALGAPRSGLWELRLDAIRGPERFESTQRFEVLPSEGSP